MNYPINPETGRPDYTNGDHSAKNWFKIMLSNGYIFLAGVAFTAIILEFIFIGDLIYTVKDNFYDSIFGGIVTIIGFLIPWAILAIVIWKGFIQFWRDLKSGRSR
jgi:hypothetical protein